MSPCTASDFHAFILAAGQGSRLRPHTDYQPKPMVEVAGKPILGHTLDHLRQEDVKKVVINVSYQAQVIEEFVQDIHTPSIILSREHTPLETGLGVKRALQYMEENPFFLLNGDALWEDGPYTTALSRLAKAWRQELMDILLLLQPVQQMQLSQGSGDYILNEDGRAVRQIDKSGDLMFTGIRICKPDLWENTSDTAFSFLELMDRAEQQGRLYGLIHDGTWHHISTPQDLHRINEYFHTAQENHKTPDLLEGSSWRKFKAKP